MKKIIMTAAAIGLAGPAFAGGIDRSGQSITPIFEKGRVIQFSIGSVSPNVSGVERVIGFPVDGDASGDVAPTYTLMSGAYKADINEMLSYAVIVDQPFGASVDYPTGTGYYSAGANAELKSTAVTSLIKYTTDANLSVYGGVRAQSMEAVASVPIVAGYAVTGDKVWDFGWVAGVAFEKPEIALRVSLTYNSAITHDVPTTETGPVPGSSSTVVETPQSVNLEFQTGIAEGTLLFGSARWVEWSKFDITPVGYFGATSGDSLVSFDNDKVSYALGVGRRLNENWAVALSGGFEKASGGIASNLSPTDGNRSIGVGATYTKDNVKISGGVRYIWIGDAMTELGALSPAADFTGNSGVAIGMSVAIQLQ